jgi:uncharacterized protein
MSEQIIDIIAGKFSFPPHHVKNVIKLLDEGATVPFISRYRKEMTGSMDETGVVDVKDTYEKLQDVIKRKESILKTLEEQENLTPELKQKIEHTWELNELEDIYLPYKPKRKTRASVAREKGLEPLAKILMAQREMNIFDRASEFISDDVEDAEEALQGARDIIAEWINENKRARDSIRNLFKRKALIQSKVIKKKEEEAEKYKDYFDFSEPLKRCPAHRILAVRRGESEGFLRVHIAPEEDEALDILNKQFIKGVYDVSRQVEDAVQDAYKRLLQPSMETEFKSLAKEKADEDSIRVFSENLRQLLLAPPLGQRTVLAIDPGYRTGCKVVCLDAQGNLQHNETIYPHPPQNQTGQAIKKISSLVETFKIEAIAIGNGTASRETEHFIKKIRFPHDVMVFMVSENGASVYSASKVAREEFPEYDVTVRGSVSIGRRLMDPLAELVKIDPKSIGVGQYQHDVDQGKLGKKLDEVVESCVNSVGIDVNTASKHLLNYVSGLGPQLAQNIIDFRKENGAFSSRNALKKVPRLGDKAFELSAGFLRIKDGKHPLDNSAVHPESYNVVEKMAKDLECNISDLLKDENLRKKITPDNYVTKSTGLPTINDIMEELAKPGRDPRTKVEVFEFSPDLFRIEDVKEGMVVPGIVTNITNFGAFVDIGVKQDGLVHISQLADRYISDPNDVVKLHQHVQVKVISVDLSRRRIQLSMKEV